MTIAKHFLNSSASPVAVQPSATTLPAGFVISPGVYTFGGANYECNSEGLYRFWDPLGQTQQRVVYQSDIDALMSGLAWAAVNGHADESLSVSQRTNKAVTSKLAMLCGPTVEWAKAICDSLSIECRIARALTGATPTNYYDGHVMLEAKIGGVWRLYDLANDQTYNDLSLKDALPLQTSTPRVVLASDGYAVEPWVTSTFDVTMWQEMTMRTDAEKQAEIERVLQIPGIDNAGDGLTYFYLPTGMESRETYVTGLSASYRVISQAAWDAMFYA